jgi:hypothetical protein
MGYYSGHHDLPAFTYSHTDDASSPILPNRHNRANVFEKLPIIPGFLSQKKFMLRGAKKRIIFIPLLSPLRKFTGESHERARGNKVMDRDSIAV